MIVFRHLIYHTLKVLITSTLSLIDLDTLVNTLQFDNYLLQKLINDRVYFKEHQIGQKIITPEQLVLVLRLSLLILESMEKVTCEQNYWMCSIVIGTLLTANISNKKILISK